MKAETQKIGDGVYGEGVLNGTSKNIMDILLKVTAIMNIYFLEKKRQH